VTVTKKIFSEKQRKERGNEEAVKSMSLANVRHLDTQKKLVRLHKVVDQFRRKYPNSGIKVPKKPTMLADFEDDDDSDDSDDDDEDEEEEPVPAPAKRKVGRPKKSAGAPAAVAAAATAAAAADKKRKKRTDESDGESSGDEDADDADISLKSPIVRDHTPPITRSAIKRKNAAGSKKAALSPASKRPRGGKAAAASGSTSTKKASGSGGKSGAASGAAADDNDVVTEITSKALAYGLPIYHVKWQTGSTTWEFACDLNTEGYGSLLDRFEKSWGSRTVPVLSSDLWPRNNPADGVMAEKILDMGYCKNDTSVLVKWVGLPKEDATWERITDMMIYGFGDIVNKFRKDWGDKPIETVVLQSDTNNNNNNNNNTNNTSNTNQERPTTPLPALAPIPAPVPAKSAAKSHTQIVVKQEPDAQQHQASPVASVSRHRAKRSQGQAPSSSRQLSLAPASPARGKAASQASSGGRNHTQDTEATASSTVSSSDGGATDTSLSSADTTSTIDGSDSTLSTISSISSTSSSSNKSKSKRSQTPKKH
jgi:hypothetical protein